MLGDHLVAQTAGLVPRDMIGKPRVAGRLSRGSLVLEVFLPGLLIAIARLTFAPGAVCGVPQGQLIRRVLSLAVQAASMCLEAATLPLS